jgi:O-antigen/teichoic acid export membrane protein
MTRLKHRTIVGAFWISVEAWGQQLLQFVLFAILARLLGPQTYGLVALALMVIVAGDVLITNGGWSEALIQRRDLDPRCIDTVFWFLLAAAGALVILLAGLVATAFRQPELAGIIAWLSTVLPLASLSVVPDALLRRELRNAPLAARSLLATAGAGLVAVPMALTGFGVWSLVTFQLAQPLIRALVLWVAHPWRPTLCFSGPQLREITGYVGGVLGERILGSLDFVLPRVILGHALGPAAVGQFTTARNMFDLLVQLLIRPVSRVALPSFAGLADDRARMQELFTLGAQYSALVAFPAHMGLALVAPDLIPLVLGPAWSPSVPVLQVLMLFGLILPLSLLGTALMHGIGRVGWQLALAGGSTVLLASLLALVGSTSIVAVAVAIVARAYVVFPLRVYVVRRATGLRVMPALLGSLRLLLATGLMAMAVYAWQRLISSSLHPWLSVASSAVIGMVVYGASIQLFARPLVRQGAILIRSVAGGPPLGVPGPSA